MGASFSATNSIDNGNIGVPPNAAYPPQAGWILYWIVFGIMTAAAFLFAFLTFRKPMWERVHGYLTLLIVTIAATAYFAMAAHGGDSLIPLYWNVSYSRDVFWARYIDWFLTTPLLLLDLLTIAAVPVGTMLWVVVADILMILFGLFGAVTTWSTRWGYYAIGCFFMFIVIWGLLVTGPKYARLRSTRLAPVYVALSLYLMSLFACYPIVWGLAEGSNTISPTAEIAAYGLLDILAKVVFGLLVLLVAQPLISRTLTEERARGEYDISLLEAPLIAPLSVLRRRNGGAVKPASNVPVDNGSAPAAAPVRDGYGYNVDPQGTHLGNIGGTTGQTTMSSGVIQQV